MSPRDGAGPHPAGSIFISYRRDDSADIAGRIYDWLTREFPGGKVFKDVDSIPMGDDFRDHLRRALGGCRVVLVVMGREWLDMRGPSGGRRLDDPGDYVRLEVEAALQRRPEVKVIPVVVGGGEQPTADKLPESLRDLCFLQTPQLRRDPDFVTDMGRLITRLKALLTEAAPAREPEREVALRSDEPAQAAEAKCNFAVHPARRPWMPAVLGVVVLAAAAGGWALWKHWHPPEALSLDRKTPIPEPIPVHPVIEGKPFDSGTVGETITVTLPGAVPLKLCYCPAGSFLMGSPESEDERDEDEKQVRVTIGKHFWLAQTEFTQAQWQAVMESNPSYFKGSALPVETVSWDEAQRGIEALNAKSKLPDGWTWALPEEAQWEYACRAGTTTAYSFGDAITAADANFDGDYSKNTGEYLEKTSVVARYKANAWGFYDLHGNVSEWCRDSWKEGTSAPAPPAGTVRMFRGGAWTYFGHYCRSAYRGRSGPGNRHPWLGFRPAIVLAER